VGEPLPFFGYWAAAAEHVEKPMMATWQHQTVLCVKSKWSLVNSPFTGVFAPIAILSQHLKSSTEWVAIEPFRNDSCVNRNYPIYIHLWELLQSNWSCPKIDGSLMLSLENYPSTVVLRTPWGQPQVLSPVNNLDTQRMIVLQTMSSIVILLMIMIPPWNPIRSYRFHKSFDFW